MLCTTTCLLFYCIRQVYHCFEDEQFRDEPLSNNPNAVDEFDWLYLDHIYTYDLPETKEVALAEMYATIKKFADDVNDGEGRVDMLETYASPQDMTELFLVSDFPFNMQLVEQNDAPTVITAANVQAILDDVIFYTPLERKPSWVVRGTLQENLLPTSFLHSSSWAITIVGACPTAPGQNCTTP